MPRRALSRYLGRPLTAKETRCAVDLYQGFETLPADMVATGESVLAEVGRLARAREPKPIVAGFRAKVAAGLTEQARRAGRRQPRAAAAALSLAGRWHAARLGIAA